MVFAHEVLDVPCLLAEDFFPREVLDVPCLLAEDFAWCEGRHESFFDLMDSFESSPFWRATRILEDFDALAPSEFYEGLAGTKSETPQVRDYWGNR